MRAVKILSILVAASSLCACASSQTATASHVLETASLTEPAAALDGLPDVGRTEVATNLHDSRRLEAQAPTHMTLASVVTPPAAFVAFCRSNPSECAQDNAVKAKEPINLTRARYTELDRINQNVNAAIFPVSDDRLYGGKDVWVVGPSEGDCDDYAVTKRDQLLRSGWPVSSLLLTVAETPQGERHALLIVSTDRGDLVLDNRSTWILLWQKTDYRWVAQQSPQNPTVWQAVAPEEAEPQSVASIIN